MPVFMQPSHEIQLYIWYLGVFTTIDDEQKTFVPSELFDKVESPIKGVVIEAASVKSLKYAIDARIGTLFIAPSVTVKTYVIYLQGAIYVVKFSATRSNCHPEFPIETRRRGLLVKCQESCLVRGKISDFFV
tara:strand:- start:32 stop:427 length:396 start_codon:yes stop_codon:yes gene_type:complete